MKQRNFVYSLLSLALIVLPAPLFAGTENVALKCPYVSSDPNQNGWDQPGLTDGDAGGNNRTCWASDLTDAFPKFVTVDLGKDRQVQTVAISMPNFGSTKTVEVSLSTDNVNFTLFAKKEFQQGKAERAVLTGPKTTARYVRLAYPDHYDKEAGYNINHVFTSELEVYECPPAEVVVKTAAVTPAVKDSYRHQQFLNRIKSGPVNLLFLGDSITDFWPRTGELTWLKFAPYSPADFGISGDRTQHLLWRITNGELDEISPKATVIMIGTNNTGDTPENTAEGVKAIVETVRQKLPQTKILLLGIFPRDSASSQSRQKNTAVNEIISKLDDGKSVFYLDISSAFLDGNGEISSEIMPDKLHPSAKGYDLWYNAMMPKLTELLN